ncbi:MAG: LysR family transcriptional regulator [Myxococcota bacterium]
MDAPIDLNLVRAFAAVYDTGSFSSAASRLGVPRSSVSRAVAALEESLGVVLFHRTTRRVTSSEEGKLLFERCAASLQSLEAALHEMPESREAPSGTLRLTSTVDLGSSVLADVVTRYSARYPRVRVELHLTSSVVDLVRDGFDAAMRISSSKLRGSNLIARKLGTLSIGLYAAPSYLARRGAPRTPAELEDHDWVGFHGAPSGKLLMGNSPSSMKRQARIVCDDMFFMREALKNGCGVGAMPSFLADPEVAAGTLQRVLPRWLANTGTIYLVYPASKHVPLRVTAFRDLLVETLRQRPLASSARDEVNTG